MLIIYSIALVGGYWRNQNTRYISFIIHTLDTIILKLTCVGKNLKSHWSCNMVLTNLLHADIKSVKWLWPFGILRFNHNTFETYPGKCFIHKNNLNHTPGGLIAMKDSLDYSTNLKRHTFSYHFRCTFIFDGWCVKIVSDNFYLEIGACWGQLYLLSLCIS